MTGGFTGESYVKTVDANLNLIKSFTPSMGQREIA
ncbi:hypothetical protein SBDP1_880004 [Syntrophobacter sp. SbD1]|nr:hypothetical protein SBDP1_880004 [Syntrophobacter sp. SbD1]